jgi:hypothetical protein
MSPKAIALIVGGAALLGVIGWRAYESTKPGPIPHIAIVHDRSESTRDGCSSVMGLLDRVLSIPELDRRSSVTILATGDAMTANEPVQVDRFPAPVSRRAMEGPRGAQRRRKELLAGIGRKCQELTRTDVSPILLAVRRAVEQLQSLGCSSANPCQLYVQTDGEETAEPALARALRGRGQPLPEPASPILHDGIRITFCGLADTVGRDDGGPRRARRTKARDAGRAERLRQTWTAILGGNVTFEPFCPKASPTTSPFAGAR